MYEYEMMNKKTNEIRFLFGSRTLKELMSKAEMVAEEWECVCREYID